MLAIGASNFGGGKLAIRGRAVRYVSNQVTSGEIRSTWRRFQPMPTRRTNRITLFSPGLLLKAPIKTLDSTAATTITATRKTSIRIR